MKNQLILGLLLCSIIILGCNKQGDNSDKNTSENNLEIHPEILSIEEMDIASDEIEEIKLNVIYEQTVAIHKENLLDHKKKVNKMTSKEVDAVIEEYLAICNKQKSYLDSDGQEDVKVFQEMGENVTKMGKIIDDMSYALVKMDKEDGMKWVRAWLKGIEIAQR